MNKFMHKLMHLAGHTNYDARLAVKFLNKSTHELMHLPAVMQLLLSEQDFCSDCSFSHLAPFC